MQNRILLWTQTMIVLVLTLMVAGATLAAAQQFNFTTLAEASPGNADGTGSAARFQFPSGVAVDSATGVYVADWGNHTIRKITPERVVSTLAGVAGSPGSTDGTGSAARFNNPSGVATDSARNVYVTDGGNYTIRKIMPGGVVSTLAGLAGSYGNADGKGTAARFGRANDYGPFGLAVDTTGNVYVADTGNAAIRKLTPEGVLSTLAGMPGTTGTEDGTGSAARFYVPMGVAVDSAGNVYVTDYSSIRKVTPAGVVTTLAGPSAGWGISLGGRMVSRGSADGTGSAARFNSPIGVAVDSGGNVYVADASNDKIRLGIPVLTTQPVFRPNTALRLSDGHFQIEVTASTNQLVLIQATSALPTTNWITLQSVTLWNGRMTLTLPSVSDFPIRFYRAISPVP